MKAIPVLALLALGLAPQLVAQGAPLGFSPHSSSLVVRAEPAVFQLNDDLSTALHLEHRLGQSADYRWELGIAGAALLGLAGLVAANAACTPDTTSDSCVGPVVGTAAVGSLVGGVIGLFIGAGIEKSTRSP